MVVNTSTLGTKISHRRANRNRECAANAAAGSPTEATPIPAAQPSSANSTGPAATPATEIPRAAPQRADTARRAQQEAALVAVAGCVHMGSA